MLPVAESVYSFSCPFGIHFINQDLNQTVSLSISRVRPPFRGLIWSWSSFVPSFHHFLPKACPAKFESFAAVHFCKLVVWNYINVRLWKLIFGIFYIRNVNVGFFISFFRHHFAVWFWSRPHSPILYSPLAFSILFTRVSVCRYLPLFILPQNLIAPPISKLVACSATWIRLFLHFSWYQDETRAFPCVCVFTTTKIEIQLHFVLFTSIQLIAHFLLVEGIWWTLERIGCLSFHVHLCPAEFSSFVSTIHISSTSPPPSFC